MKFFNGLLLFMALLSSTLAYTIPAGSTVKLIVSQSEASPHFAVLVEPPNGTGKREVLTAEKMSTAPEVVESAAYRKNKLEVLEVVVISKTSTVKNLDLKVHCCGCLVISFFVFGCFCCCEQVNQLYLVKLY